MKIRPITLLQTSLVLGALAVGASGLGAQTGVTAAACLALDPTPPCDCTFSVQCQNYSHPNCWCDTSAGQSHRCIVGTETGLCRC